jgi:hypothetical protein
MKHSLAGACFLLYNENTIWQGGKTILPIYRQYKNIETEPLKGPKFRKPRTETQKRWNFALCSLRRLLSDLRPKLARAACSNKGLRSDAMLAHKANSNVSAYSVRGSRNFYLIGSVTIIKTVQS